MKNFGPITGVHQVSVTRKVGNKGCQIPEKLNGSLDATLTEDDDIFIRGIIVDEWACFLTMAGGLLQEIGEPAGNIPGYQKVKVRVRVYKDKKDDKMKARGTLTLGKRGNDGEIVFAKISLENDGNGSFRPVPRLIAKDSLHQKNLQTIVDTVKRMESERNASSQRKPASEPARAPSKAPTERVVESQQVIHIEEDDARLLPSSKTRPPVVVEDSQEIEDLLATPTRQQ